ncbi:MAG: restriction endonuclease subunit S, partial [Candidatus Poribacteria bacterium]|nr:restriction endonuclease subunit S [Candidatus Poribacteria bacterium]
QLAVQGKLVLQDPNDEPASELLERIQTEKAYLIKKKKIKRSKPLPPIEAGEVPYDLPDGWKWTKLDPVTINVHYGYTAKADRFITDVRMLRITDIQNNRVDWSSVPGCEIDDGTFLGYELRDGDILIARTGGTIGKTYLVKGISDRAVFASYLIRVVPSPEISAEYLKLFAESPIYWKQLIEKSSGTGQPNVNSTSLRSLILPLPPVNEQKRIVAKVDQFMTLCDQLEARLKTAQEEGEKLLAAMIREKKGQADVSAPLSSNGRKTTPQYPQLLLPLAK